jgi:tRNA uridine 5-carbamoylmethylation protein Kti12
MSKIIILQGLPASGKSTKAKELLESSGNSIRVNRDLLRKMLHNDKWNGKKESITIDIEKSIIASAISKNINVIIDDTNFGKTAVMWKMFAESLSSKAEIIAMNTSVEECIKRDENRENSVGKDVIINMARASGLYDMSVKDVICDLDGTLCNIDHRLHYVKDVEKKDWKSFFENLVHDTPRQDVIDMLNEYKTMGCRIVFVSGRPDNYKRQTKEWLSKNYPEYDTLIMRRADDKRPDDEVKSDILERYFKKDNVEVVIDDRPSVIRMWISKSLSVIDVGSGVEF